MILPLLKQVHDIHVAVHPEVYLAETDPGELLALLREMLGHEAMTGLLAVGTDGAPLGYAIYEIEVRMRSPLKQAQRHGFLHQIGVDRDWRRSGIGLALIGEMRARLQARGVMRMRTSYATFNEPAAAFMRKAGFAPVHVMADGAV